MAIYYLSPVDYIKNKTFDVLCPAFYQPGISEEMLDARPVPLEKPNPYRMVATRRRNPAPFRQTFDPHQLGKGGFSIEIMLDMFRKKIQFHLLNEQDVVEIMDGIDRYLMSLQSDVERGNEAIISYALLVVDFRTEMYKHYYRYMKTHPTVYANLFPNQDPKNNLFSILSAVSGTTESALELDPLRAKAKPPYPIKKYDPDANKVSSNEDNFESSLGLSNGVTFKEDSGDFSLEDFLKR